MDNYFTLAIKPVDGSSAPSQGIVNLTSDSTAKGVGIQLSIGAGESSPPVDLLSSPQFQGNLPGASGITNHEIPLKARSIQTENKITAGQVKGMVMYTIDYH